MHVHIVRFGAVTQHNTTQHSHVTPLTKFILCCVIYSHINLYNTIYLSMNTDRREQSSNQSKRDRKINIRRNIPIDGAFNCIMYLHT